MSDPRRNLFSSSSSQQRPPAPRGYGEPARGGYGAPDPYGGQGYGNQPPPQVVSRQAPGAGRAQGRQLRLAKVDDKTIQAQYIFGNICAVSPNDFPPTRDGSDLYIRLTGPQLRGDYVVTARPTPGFPNGCISLSDPVRTWCGIGMMDELVGEIYDPFGRGGQAYLGSIDVEVGFASLKKIVDEQYDQDELADLFIKSFQNQIFAPGQRLLLDVRNVPLAIMIKTVTLTDLTMQASQGDEAPVRTDPGARGILYKQTSIGFYKDAKSPLKLKASNKRPAANAIISPDFKFEDMGIGGLDSEFSTIFRRAFASRIFPPGLIEKLGIMHVKGMLLYGPPGTGKTLIARQIGKMLNAREPKIINGPEVLNKYVGQSEENIRKLFADAEKEYKEKGDESGLHIIIFDELDAVCKQRGSGAGGGTGVGDSVVNQLLSKLDGVDQLNNILLIGMTNRKDMIDDALLRPGRLEVQIEISLPDEFGRSQILKIHTSKMKENKVMGDDVDIPELAALTKNFSGAELSGLVKSATSFAFARNIKAGTTASVSDDVVNMKVGRQDFFNALKEVKPAFGTDDTELEDAMPNGIIHFSPGIGSILRDGMLSVDHVRTQNTRLTSVLIHGPPASGKTALAAYIAMKSDYPFIKIITPASLVGFRDEGVKKDHIHKIFTDAYKSPLSMLIIDDIERIIEWLAVGPRLSNSILQALLTLVKTPPPKDHRLLIVATTSQRHVMEQLDVTRAFDQQIPVPAISDLNELERVLTEVPGGPFEDPAQARRVCEEIQSITQTTSVRVGIKTILTTAEMAKLSTEPVEWFAGQIAERVSRYT